jgi:non-ribosomal peptide synthetase component F
VVAPARALARREGATLFMVLLAAFDVLLARLSGSDDVVVGTQVAGRTREETEGLIGIFVNGLALRTDLSGDPSFREAVARVRRATLDAYAHPTSPSSGWWRRWGWSARWPSARLQRLLPPADGRERAGRRLAPGPDGGGAALPRSPSLRGAEDELAIRAARGRKAGCGRASYSTELFEHDTAARLVAEYGRLLAALVAAPNAPISAPPRGRGGGRARGGVLRRAAGVGRRAPAAPPVRGVGGARAPSGRAAAGRRDGHLRGAERARQPHRAPAARAGRGPRVRVGVALERSADLVAVAPSWRVLKAGGAYVPLDPAHPAERLRFMRADAGVAAVVTVDPALRGRRGAASRVVCLACERAEIDALPADDLDGRGRSGESLAYVIYTSGSTGRPKGVARAAPRRGRAGAAQEFAARAGDGVPAVAPAARSTRRCWRSGARC